MNIIFTDIDGVLNSAHKNKWLPNAISIYNRICDEFELKPVITSTWRTNHTKRHLQNIFDYYGIEQDIYDYTPILPCQPRGVEIETDKEFVNKNNIKKIGAIELILIFEHYYGLDIGDYGLKEFIVHPDKPNYQYT